MEIQMTPIESTLKMENAHIEADRMSRLRREVAAMLEDLSGLDLTDEQCATSFLELGFDSLMLTQAAQSLETQFGIKIAFRQLMDGVDSIDRVAELLDRKMPAEVPPARCANAPAADKSRPTNGNLAVPPAILPPNLNSKNGASNEAMMQQLQSMAQWIQSQMQTLGAAAQIPAPFAPVASGLSGGANAAALNAGQNGATSHPAAHHATEMTAEQKRFLDRLVERYVEKTAKSKAFTQQHRQALADPRVASGFRPEWKEMVYSIVSSRSRGSKLWDIDGNEYIDLLNGFGPTMFGHSPEFVTRAVLEQLNEGFAIGPQTPLAGRAAELLTEMTGAERVTFCNTGSEAVMAAMRIARTVTGRDRIVYFSGDYHGQFDEVLAKPWKHKGEIGARPSAPGIPRANLGNIVVLDYGTKEALEYIEQHAGELAAVLVEPMQSRHPELRPKEFLTRLREITFQSKTALVFDEVVTGFRIHPRGAQGYYGIQADLATYGKVVAGGMPIGILAGKAAFMDALDGGAWQYGDSSVPEVGVTFFAGTFVRHPLTMAALCATLEHIRGAGQPLYDELNRRADRFAERLKETVASCGDAVHVEHCGSVFFLSVSRDHRFAGLLYYLLREKGIFLLEGFPFYLTTAHSDADLQFVLRAFRESVTEMQKCGLLPHAGVNEPVPLGRSEQSPEIPLTEPQMEVLLAAQVSDKASCAYNESFRIVLDGPLNRAAMESAWQKLIARHDALRMSLIPSGDGMRIHAHAAIPMRWIDLSGITSEDGKNKLQALIIEEGLKPFDLVNGPLVRAMVLRFSPERHVLVVTAHHLVCDGWSVNVVVDELGEL
jgi:glutamate-1-semialdehyde aminotransferase/acyl carrier protein